MTQWTRVFYDDFTTDGDDVDRNVWTTPQWDKGWGDGPWNPSYLGRTSLRNPEDFTGKVGLVPVVDSCAQLRLSQFNPVAAGKALLGAEIDTRAYFGGVGINQVKFEAVVKIDPQMPAGAVLSLFGYDLLNVQLNNPDNGLRDEIDLELGSNYFHDNKQINTNLYVDSGGAGLSPVQPKTPNVNFFSPLTLTVIWSEGQIEWLVNGDSIRTYSGRIPNHGLRMCLNIWAPADDWKWAYNRGLQPVHSGGSTWIYYVDSAAVFYG